MEANERLLFVCSFKSLKTQVAGGHLQLFSVYHTLHLKQIPPTPQHGSIQPSRLDMRCNKFSWITVNTWFLISKLLLIDVHEIIWNFRRDFNFKGESFCSISVGLVAPSLVLVCLRKKEKNSSCLFELCCCALYLWFNSFLHINGEILSCINLFARRSFWGAISFNILYTKENCSNIAMKKRAFLTVKLDP